MTPKKSARFNVNNRVRVRLTEAGRRWHRKEHDEFLLANPGVNLTYQAPREDVDGWSTWQLHSLMSTFGDGIHVGGELLFETEMEMIWD